MDMPVGSVVADSILLVTHVPLLRSGRRVLLDDQTCRGLDRWAENFGRVVFTGIDAVDARAGEHGSSTVWQDISELPCAGRLEAIVLPRAYRVAEFVRSLRAARAVLREKLLGSRYRCFTIGALAGDWGGVAALECMRLGLDYAVWFDRVEHEVIRNTLPAMTWRRRLKERALLPMMERYHRSLVSRSRVGLFQGRDCFEAFARNSSRPYCVYDTHTEESDKISAEALDAKVARALAGRPLHICYAGRASDMKGPLDWLRALGLARDAGVRFSAEWLGDGPLLADMRAEIVRLRLENHVRLRGFEGDRAKVLEALTNADFFLFCHKTPESPRCLVEALVCGAPLVGYHSSYAAELTGVRGGGVFTPIGAATELMQAILRLDADRPRLASLMRAAAASGSGFDEATVYRQRCDIIRRHL